MPATTSTPTEVFPTPFFEGSEKRLELTFELGDAAPARGLRALPRDHLDAICTAAHCCIVSVCANEDVDAYVLSESSLFVFPTKLVMKTCGTTRLLDAVPLILELAAAIEAQPARARYSRASYLAAEHQPAPHNCFESEVAFLQRHFGHLPGGSSAHVMGDALNGLQWHVYVADKDQPASAQRLLQRPSYTLEVCMTELCSVKASRFFRGHCFESSRAVTTLTGIRALAPKAEMDDYVFEPCGYSMNGIQNDGFMTIHVTPEDGFSYASVEMCCYDLGIMGPDPQAIVRQVLDIFGPKQASVSLSIDAAAKQPWADAFAVPTGYACHSASLQDLRGGGYVAYFVLGAMQRYTKHLAHDAGLDSVASLAAALPEAPNHPPRSILTALPSYGILSSCGADSDGEHSSASESLASSMMLHNGAEPDDGSGTRTPSPRPDCSGLYQALAAVDAVIVPEGGSDAFAAGLINRLGLEDSFYVVDLGALTRLHQAWTAALPRVTPHYAVKCNMDTGLLRTLSALGCGFDCASAAELDVVTRLGVTSDRIIFANACKRPSDIRHAASSGIALTTFDSICELEKMARWNPNANAVLRIRADDPEARCQLGNKYGCEAYEVRPLLEAAMRLKLTVVGVSFHVGSGATNPVAFSQAIEAARSAWDIATDLGFSMRLLDIGGGFAAGDGLLAVADAVNAALGRHFADERIRVIAEPGRYFAESVATYHTMVFGVRERPSETSGTTREYWVTDGLYGSMNSVLYDHASLSCRVLKGVDAMADKTRGKGMLSTVFGPTCDGLDTLLRDVELPAMGVGDWLAWPAMGAYTQVGACDFNGIVSTARPVFYVVSGAV